MHLDPKICDLILSNNQNEQWKQMISKKIDNLINEVQKLKDENQKQRMEKLNQYWPAKKSVNDTKQKNLAKVVDIPTDKNAVKSVKYSWKLRICFVLVVDTN